LEISVHILPPKRDLPGGAGEPRRFPINEYGG
jgi:hypothetical protein